MGTAERGETAKRLIDDIRADGYPRRETYSLLPMDGAVRLAVMADAVREAGHDIDDPGSVEQYWFESKDMIVIDLEPKDG